MKSIAKSINGLFYATIFCFAVATSLMSFQNPAIITEGNCPTASFTTSNNGCEGPCGITFNNASSEALTYHWDFGDGTTSCEENPTHNYRSAGTYQVKLRAIGIGCTTEFIGTVDIIDN